MNHNRRELIITSALAALAAASSRRAIAEPASDGIYRVAEPQVLLAAARTLIRDDSITTFITLDSTGQPRARSVLASSPDDDLTIYIGTRRGSRKLTQISANPRATLHFAIDASNSYLSLMGMARLLTDPAVIEVKSPYQGKLRQTYFPRYPEDFALIGFTPASLEVMTGALAGTRETWQPQGVLLK